MKQWATLIFILGTASAAWAQDLGTTDVDRDPAAVTPTSRRRNFPGSDQEDELRVQSSLAKAEAKTDQRSVQREVYKQMFNTNLELKEEQHEDAEE